LKVGVITYDIPHLKTQQLLSALVLDQELEISLYVIPFRSRTTRNVLFSHRPNMATGGYPKEVASARQISILTIPDVRDIEDDADVYVLGGAGLLPGEFVTRATVINVHPGLIPTVRGLDAFKWAIHDDLPLGVSMHVLDAEVDLGRHLKSVPTPIYVNDTLGTLARRHYENEITLLANFRRFLEHPAAPLSDLEERAPRKRMPKDTEKAMVRAFPQYVARHCLT